MGRPDLRAELRREETLRGAQGLPPGAKARVWARLEASREGAAPRRAQWMRWGPALALATVAILVGLWSLRPEEPLEGLRIARASGALQVRAAAGGVEFTGGPVTLVDEARGLSVEGEGALTLRREPEGLRLVRGRAGFSVRKRTSGEPPVVVLVPGGAIRVLGTRFTVEAREVGGVVALHEGRIRFEPHGGEVVLLQPGQTLTWPAAKATTSPGVSPAVQGAASGRDRGEVSLRAESGRARGTFRRGGPRRDGRVRPAEHRRTEGDRGGPPGRARAPCVRAAVGAGGRGPA